MFLGPSRSSTTQDRCPLSTKTFRVQQLSALFIAVPSVATVVRKFVRAPAKVAYLTAAP